MTKSFSGGTRIFQACMERMVFSTTQTTFSNLPFEQRSIFNVRHRRSNMYRKLFSFLLVMILSGVSAVWAAGDSKPVTGKAFPGIFMKKVDNFVIVLDGSMSMIDMYGDSEKLTVAKDTLNKMNEIMPDMTIIGALRLCGNGSCPEGSDSRLVFGPEYYTKIGLKTAVAGVGRPSGSTPMALSVSGVKGDLKTLKGSTAVIVVSDGVDVRHEAVQAVSDLKAAYGDDVTLYAVRVGDNPKATESMDKLAAAGGSKSAYAAAELLGSNENMASFVETVFLTQVFDADQDGVYDHKDKCPGTPSGVTVDKNGCPIDSDGDGVPDSLDRCSDTPRGARVDSRGCWEIGSVHFDFNKAEIKSTGYSILENVVEVMKQNAALKVVIGGHTDNVGTEAYNMNLSRKRAESAKVYLMKHGIRADRIRINGYGMIQPAVSNDTEDGRARNRRVEFSAQKL